MLEESIGNRFMDQKTYKGMRGMPVSKVKKGDNGRCGRNNRCRSRSEGFIRLYSMFGLKLATNDPKIVADMQLSSEGQIESRFGVR